MHFLILAHPSGKITCLYQEGKNQSHYSSRGESIKRGRGRNNFKGGGNRHRQGEKFNDHYLCCGRNGHGA